jgi:two-component sensor histidine kinase
MRSIVLQSALTSQNLDLKRLLELAAVNTAERDVADKIQGVLTEELHHRMKNMMTMVTAIVRQSLKTAHTLPEAARAIEARMMAMARAHDLLLKADLKAAGLAGIVFAAIEQHNSVMGRIEVSGDDFDIVSGAIVPVTLMLNELCTNAAKYGALSKEGGTVALSWTKKADSIVFHWVESGGPAVVAPGRRSLGSKLIEDALPRQLGGRGKLSFAETGVAFEFVVPAKGFEAPPMRSSAIAPSEWNQSSR